MSSDARVRYTKMTIKKNLIKLLKIKPINKITVKEICNLSEINRSTFYKHYEDVYDLYGNLETDMLEEFREILDSVKSKGIRKTITEVLEKLKRNEDLYAILFTESNNGDYFRQKMFMQCYSQLVQEENDKFSYISEEKKEWAIFFLVWGSSGVLDSWFKNGMHNSPEEVAVFIEALVNNTMKTLEQGKNLF